MVHYGIALTKKTVYQDFRNIDLFGRKSGESVKEKFRKLELLDAMGIKSAGCLASFILCENTRRMTPHLLKSDVPFKSNSKNKIFFFPK